MAKVKCSVCANEKSRFCTVKKIGVNINKTRRCEAYIYDESKVKARQEVPSLKVGYRQQQDNKKRMKEELKALRKMLKQGPENKTARDLGLQVDGQGESRIITPGDPRFVMPSKDPKHPLTGDLSRFTSSVDKKGE